MIPKSSPTLLATLHCDCDAWIQSQQGLIANERDMQVMLAMHLIDSKHYDLVDTEYRVPLTELVARGVKPGSLSFPWENQLSVDIVVARQGQYAAIELKYATTIVDYEFVIFGERMRRKESQIIKNQAASNLTMYNYWKDVRRIETLSRVFEHVVGGLAIIITNNHTYWKSPRAESNYAAYSMHEGNTVGGGPMKWLSGVSPKILKSHPHFELSGLYTCNWHNTKIKVRATNGDHFKYCISTITNSKNQ